MPEVQIKGSASSGELRAEMPRGWPDGEYQVILRRDESPEEVAQRKQRLRIVLERLARSGRKADPAELDARIQELRDSWD